MLSENAFTLRLHSTGRWSDDEVAMCTYWPTINKKTSLNKPMRKREVIIEVVSPEVSKLNHAAMNKTQGDQMQFFA